MSGPDPEYLLRGSGDSITALCPRHNTHLVTGTQTGDVIIWDLRTRRVTSRLTEAHGAEMVLGIHCHGDHVLTQGRDHRIRKWKWEENSLIPDGE